MVGEVLPFDGCDPTAANEVFIFPASATLVDGFKGMLNG
jgi:hypothetical protein